MIHHLPPFAQVVRHGLPAFEVIRKPLFYANETHPVGVPIPDVLATNRIRVRQLYEQRLIGVSQQPLQQQQQQQAHNSNPSTASKPAIKTTLKASASASKSSRPKGRQDDLELPAAPVKKNKR